MIRTATLLALLLLHGACDSDSTSRADGATDQGATDTAADTSTPPDGPTPDRAVSDAPVDLPLPDTSLADGGHLLACNKILDLCQNSTIWTLYLTPFTLENCQAVLSCVTQLYTGVATCDTTFQSLIICAAGIQTSEECDTKCATDVNYLLSTCPCPDSCGVPCM